MLQSINSMNVIFIVVGGAGKLVGVPVLVNLFIHFQRSYTRKS